MRIILSGSSGLIGSALVSSLQSAGNDVIRFVRRASSDPATEIEWDPARGRIDMSSLNGADAIIHLSGENVAAGRWTSARKVAIRESRVQTTSFLASVISQMEQPPKTWLCASAIGYYGDTQDRVVTEIDQPGNGFLADVCRAWENATRPAADAGIRVVNLRFGVVLSDRGGALEKMLMPIRLGVGGALGDGRQYVSWVALEDAIGGILHVLNSRDVSGPVNITSPNPVTNMELTKTLGRVLSRPTALAAPAFALRLALGEMADEMLLTGARALPERLLQSGYRFAWPDLEPALRHLLKQ
ncbi:MAG: TIGR01777 family oxidoreductase [Candidatus Hydrogenedentes bacterium]|nr:TIGR01777 family oxidoreductase [Candidatus Hydrogenedentota bacterium]